MPPSILENVYLSHPKEIPNINLKVSHKQLHCIYSPQTLPLSHKKNQPSFVSATHTSTTSYPCRLGGQDISTPMMGKLPSYFFISFSVPFKLSFVLFSSLIKILSQDNWFVCVTSQTKKSVTPGSTGAARRHSSSRRSGNATKQNLQNHCQAIRWTRNTLLWRQPPHPNLTINSRAKGMTWETTVTANVVVVVRWSNTIYMHYISQEETDIRIYLETAHVSEQRLNHVLQSPVIKTTTSRHQEQMKLFSFYHLTSGRGLPPHVGFP